MPEILNILLFILFVFSIFLFRKIRKQQSSLAAARSEISSIQAILDEKSLDADSLPEPEMRLTLKVHDPIMVAKRESKSAQFVGDLLPEVVTRKVYQQIQAELDASLKERDIKADIKIEIF